MFIIIPLCFHLLFQLQSCYGAIWTGKVCRTFEDYHRRENNENCWYNPDVDASPEELTSRYGLNLTRHEVETQDGYILTLFRVGNGRNGLNQSILLHHGLAANALCFMTSGSRSLAFYLSHLGFDVWLANSRGTIFSSKHKWLTEKDKKFWDISFHEIGLYDLPPVLEYITQKTGKKGDLVYIGHSMGTNIMTVYASMLKTHASKHVKKAILICPTVNMKYTRGIIPVLAPILIPILEKLNLNVVYHPSGILPRIQSVLCQKSIEICDLTIRLLQGTSHGNFLPEDLAVFLSYSPSNIIVKSMIHFLQGIISKGLSPLFDYGRLKNIEIYNRTSPPEYNIPSIEIPVHLIYGARDFWAGRKDSTILFKRLKTKDKSLYGINGYNHLDFLFAHNVEEYLYKYLLRIINI